MDVSLSPIRVSTRTLYGRPRDQKPAEKGKGNELMPTESRSPLPFLHICPPIAHGAIQIESMQDNAGPSPAQAPPQNPEPAGARP